MNLFSLSSSVESLFQRWPETIQLFNQNHMACPGCYLASFESLEGALQIYQIKAKPFLDNLHQIVVDSDERQRQASQRNSDSKG
jgi:hybrid cluster-associated redox disulfide protein